MSGNGLQSGARRTLTGLLTAAIVLVAAPTASAQLDHYVAAGFTPVVRIRFSESGGLDAVEKQRNVALNAAVAAHPQLAIPAPRFSLVAAGADETASISALDCMTAAIYFEAANEPITGQRAVAQVILNRVRHPAFPNTVCGVVFQGSDRTTGCQFTFTCDGSLMRRPSPALWNRARTIAAASLGGFVETSVGHATHYHAAYVLPYWAPRLTKLTAIGSHIFYQWKGGWADPAAYTARYAGSEAIPPAARSLLSEYLLSSEPHASAQLAAAQIPGRAELSTADVPVEARTLEGKTADMGPTGRHGTNLNVAKSELIETGARLKDSKPAVLASNKSTPPH